MKKVFFINLQRNKTKAILLVLIFVIILAIAIIGLKLIEGYEFRQRGEENVFVPSAEEDSLVYKGREYIRNRDIDSVLIAGVDKYSGEKPTVGKNSERADFLLLLAIDTRTKTYKALHINRDSMANVKELGIKGDEIGYRQMQIALSHTYGDGKKQSAKNTKDAAENLLYGMPIEHYIVFNMDAVGIIADKVGGVCIEQDMVLTGAAALSYVRSRNTENAEGNLERMARQRLFLSALKDKTQECLESDEAFISDSVLDISQYMISDLNIYQLDDYADILITAPDTEIKTLSGETVIGEKFIEYYCDADSVKENIIEMFYE